MNKRYWWTGLLLAFLVLDTGFTFWQALQFPLDGDLVAIVLPSEWYSKVLQDPFGWAVLTENATYAGAGRFFAHASMGVYWKQMPQLLQAVVSPIESLYVTSALFTTLAQVLVLLALAAFVRLGSGARAGMLSFLLAAALLAPLFQIAGFYEQMGVANRAITYTFFYAFPLGLLLVLLWPFFRAAYARQPLHLTPVRTLLLVLLMVVVAFNGPIAVASIAVLLLGVGLHWLAPRVQRAWAASHNPWLSGQAMVLLGLLGLLSAYALFVGRNNAENSHSHTLGQLFKLLPKGVYLELTTQWGLPLLLGVLLLNVLLIWRLVPASRERQWALVSAWAVAAFSVVFLLLLPFGGYRDYRPYLVRGDSILPIILALFYAYGVTTYFLLRQLRGPVRAGYAGIIGVFLLVFMYQDAVPKLERNNDCEQWALDQIARSPESQVRISSFCNVLSWGPMTDPSQSELQARMLYYWKVTSRPTQYYQPQ
ncbi:hypothetical protein [Hymenobacter pini]|uniref:hypothetical protein n=1 Tax=Hymenobacter pini TaxID=2880879 RepID=UPI001CF4C54C|nr:hypothetical protein [Hymenobacter pini]MCA8832424.1 hypothetical protein [Hymenobacter pini]